MAGYSATPLWRKLGLKAGHRVRVSHAPGNYAALVAGHPPAIVISGNIRKDIDIWHFFSSNAAQLEARLPVMLRSIRADGMIWVSWPKNASGVPSSITEDTVRQYALPLGLVDVKVCAVDDTWSALKLVIRKENRL